MLSSFLLSERVQCTKINRGIHLHSPTDSSLPLVCCEGVSIVLSLPVSKSRAKLQEDMLSEIE
ncbi:hypothetical protein M988_2397 [Hafnia paralvei ATCC 29927]|nr:hypothetical protein M988_2397 [Hafnia paralvei ATCC 29927]RDA71416.1 hypothetical protein DU449_03030 [Hafnia paralvei]RDA72395.1 hypothetical protein DVH08_03885 [Hafnia paralvei]RDA81118.1 hypothetical protein DVH10_02750 [Hafnia paralvei]RDA81533.1 hypothetical protein DVH07_02580 [Hafnia paralvei]